MRLPFLDRFRRKTDSADPQKPKYAPRRRRILVIEEEDPDAPPPSRGLFSDARSKFLLVASLVAIGATAVVMLVERRAASVATEARPDRPAQVALGRTIYRQGCAYCHGSEREGHEEWRPDTPVSSGLAPPLDERSPAVERPDRDMFEIVKFGGQPFLRVGQRSQMPAFEFNLTDAQIWAVIAYLKYRWPSEALARHEAANRSQP
jgi:mono/diheme cytochrome c family protein